jgi:hypothetical protein
MFCLFHRYGLVELCTHLTIIESLIEICYCQQNYRYKFYLLLGCWALAEACLTENELHVRKRCCNICT